MGNFKIKLFYRGVPAVRVAQQNGIPEITFYMRLKKGWTIERAVETPLCLKKRNPKRQWVITNKDMAFVSASALAKYLGVTKNMVIGREHRHGSPFVIGEYTIEKR